MTVDDRSMTPSLDRDRLVAHLQLALNAALELSGLPKNAWGSVTIRVENGRVAVPLEISTKLTVK